ncbi:MULTISPECIES: hypothetical protein, partial [Cyanophyceae]
GDREQGTGNREQFQELDRSDFSFESNLNARFLSSHSLKACTFSISNCLKSFTCKVFVFIHQPLSINLHLQNREFRFSNFFGYITHTRKIVGEYG